MAGTRFIQSTLATEVALNYGRRIAEAQHELDSYLGRDPDQLHASWRSTAESKVATLYQRIVEGDASDVELTGFSIPSPPSPYDEKWTRRHLEERVAELEKARDKALAYIRSLAPVDIAPTEQPGVHTHVVEVSAVDLKRIGYGV